MPVSSERLLPVNAVLRPLNDDIQIASVTLAWHEGQHDPLLENVLDLVRGYFGERGEEGIKAT